MSALECPFCHVPLPDTDLAEGWCDSCGKKLPSFILSEATKAGISPAAPTTLPAPQKASVGSEERPAADAPTEPDNRARTTITLRGRNEHTTEYLPSLCMRCGAASTLAKEKKFRWFPLWTYLLVPFGGLPFYIALMLTRKMMTVKIPLCHRHRYPWMWQYLFLVFFLIYILVLPWFLIMLSVEAEKAFGQGNALSGTLLIGWFIGFPLFLVLAFVIKRLTIHVKEITAESITLGGVSESFAEKVGGRPRNW